MTVAAYHKEKRTVSLVTEGLKCLQQHRDMHVVSAGSRHDMEFHESIRNFTDSI